MRISVIKLENFQGISHLEMKMNGESCSIYGDNGTGKTTVFNAVTWLLFDRPSTGAKNYTPKTKGPAGDLHYLDHLAEAQFIMDDGRLVTLRKVLHENYKKKRGSATEEFDGHSVDFFIDGVPVKEREYTSSLLNFCGGAEQMKMLTMPHYFAENMAWDTRRKILLDVCGDVNDDDVIASDTSLADLRKFLLMPGTTNQFYTVDEYKKIAVAKKSDINKQLQGIPGRIDEAQRAIPEEPIDVADINAKIKDCQSRQEILTRRKAGILSGDRSAADARKRTAEAESALAEACTVHAQRSAALNQGTYEAISAVQSSIMDAQARRSTAQNNADIAKRNAEQMEDRRNELLREYTAVQAESWDESEAICPTCHRELPAEDVARMREEFNVRKSTRLQSINEKGQREASKQAVADLRQKVTQYQDEADQAGEEIEKLLKEKAGLEAQLQSVTPFEMTEEYARLSAAVSECRASEATAGKDVLSEVSVVSNQIQEVNDEMQRLQQLLGKAEQAAIQRKRIVELEQKEKDLSAQYEDLDHGIYLCDQFTKAKVRMLTDRINSKFKSVRFRLFVEQVNGGIKDDCEVLVPNEETGAMVPYRDANNAGRIKAGLEIINVLSAHWGISMPVFIDNAEGVQNVTDPDTQLIQLVVPVSWDKLGSTIQSALTSIYGGEDRAREQYEAPNKTLRLELVKRTDKFINVA